MKILITGANGMLGKAVQNEFKNEEIICTDSIELDITDEVKTMEYVSRVKPDYIINCAAYTAVDKAEEDVENADRVNAIGPKNLAIAADKNGAILVHVSTDYVFSGDKNVAEAYSEDEDKAPVTVYGSTKLKGEENVIKNCEKYYIFRTAWLYGDGKNFVRTMLTLGKDRDEVSVVTDENGSPTYAVDLANIIHQAIDKQIPFGVYHATNQGFTTWYEFTKKIFEIAEVSCNVKPITAAEFKRAAKRPTNSKLSKDKLLSAGVEIPEYEDALRRYLKEELK